MAVKWNIFFGALHRSLWHIKLKNWKNLLWFQYTKMLLFTVEKENCHTKLQTIIIKVVLSKYLYLLANWTSYPKPVKEALAILKSPLKLLITSFYNGQQLAFLENQIIFLMFSLPSGCHDNKLTFWYFNATSDIPSHGIFTYLSITENFIKDHKNDFNILF